jgi:predicted lactoylglutathione lyase
MAKKIFVNLPVKDLKRSIAFFTELGFTFNPQFTNENATCMIISDDIFVMILVENFFQKFTQKEIADATKVTESIICLSAEDREEVDKIVGKALALGATETIIPEMQQGDMMYGRSMTDLDGHIWEIMWMDPSSVQK